MKKYYLVAAKDFCKGNGAIEIKLVDCPPTKNNGYEYLKTIEAENYNEAISKVTFIKNINGNYKAI